MLLDAWSTAAILGVLSLAGLTAWGVAFAYSALVRRRVTTLEFAVADLEERLLKEIKTRAGNLGVKARKANEELEELMLKKAAEPAQQQPWWMSHVHPDLKQN